MNTASSTRRKIENTHDFPHRNKAKNNAREKFKIKETPEKFCMTEITRSSNSTKENYLDSDIYVPAYCDHRVRIFYGR